MRFIFSALFCVTILFSCQKDVTLIHINDTHSHLFGSDIHCKYSGSVDNFYIGGYDLIIQAVNDARKSHDSVLFLHAGDLIQGTRYFRQFQGTADIDLMNLAKIDALELGNHEFDKGPDFLADLLEKAKFPILAANIQFPEGSKLKKIIKPYIITGTWPFRNGIIGVITPDTANISSPGTEIQFSDPAETVKKYVRELKNKGVSRIFVLSHLGFEEDNILAQKVEGIDVIIGGHSHSAMGFSGIDCVPTEGNYPETVKDPAGRTVLIVQAWDQARALGIIDLKFDFKGEISSWDGKTIYPIRESVELPFPLKRSPFNEFVKISPDKSSGSLFKSYEESVSNEYLKIIATSTEELEHKWEKGSDIGPLVAESILIKLKNKGYSIDISLQNAGGIRKSIHQGEITLGDVYDILPFFNNITIFKIKGSYLVSELKNIIEKSSKGASAGAFPYLAGMKFEIKNGAAVNFSVIENGETKPVDPEKIYTVATDSYIAQGGNGYDAFYQIKEKTVTPYIVSDVFAEFLKEKSVISKPAEKHSSF
ncbi:MAG TPA: bifunctional metallophosphatase/5'-nucleotidase [bacterium]|nr:bifunctional metallophosphatase/5'-nucleotidase [bacterium]